MAFNLNKLTEKAREAIAVDARDGHLEFRRQEAAVAAGNRP